jgi:HK97 family phage major capsid protein
MKKHQVGVVIEKQAFIDEGDGVISFPNGLPITDSSEQRNGTRYDIDSMKLSEYKGQVTADHVDRLDHIIAQAEGIRKAGNQVVVSKLKYLVAESAYARLAYNLLIGRQTSDFSIETYGPMPDDEGVYHNATLIGLSQVVVGNNRNASVNSIVRNSIEQSKKDGLDTQEIETAFDEKQIRVQSSHSNNKVNEENKMSEVKTEDNKVEEKKTEEAKSQGIDLNALTEAMSKVMDEKLAPVQAKIAEIEQNAFDKGAKEPTFKKDQNAGAGKVENDFSKMDWQERHGAQINAAWDLLKRNDHKAAEILNEINNVNLEALKAEKKVRNSLTISDFGNFVISPELLTEIEGTRNDFSALLNATQWKETLSTQMAWLARSGDINMTSVEFCDDNADGNLKPISEYSATLETANLEELAAVTPVCNAATRFLAADLLEDVAAGYRTDYDRKRAQLVIARLEQAVEETGKVKTYDISEPTTVFFQTMALLAANSINGTFIMNASTYADILGRATVQGVNGQFANYFVTGSTPSLVGRPFIVVPDELMPTINGANTKVFEVNGANVTVNNAIFYADLSTFTGRTSGGLQYDLSTDAAYEVGEEVRSAYQRNELVLRGSFFRGGAVKDVNKVAAVAAVAVS